MVVGLVVWLCLYYFNDALGFLAFPAHSTPTLPQSAGFYAHRFTARGTVRALCAIKRRRFTRYNDRFCTAHALRAKPEQTTMLWYCLRCGLGQHVFINCADMLEWALCRSHLMMLAVSNA